MIEIYCQVFLWLPLLDEFIYPELVEVELVLSKRKPPVSLLDMMVKIVISFLCKPAFYWSR